MNSGTSRYFLWFGLFVLLLACPSNAHKSKQLVKYDEFTKKFLLDPDALSDLASLEAPIKIIAAIGDARVGKSTALNIMRHIWKRKSPQKHFEKVFNTSNKMEACTRGVWISVIPDTDRESVVLLDVEGSNLGNDAKTNQFSIFVTLLSSSLMLFGEETVTNHNRDFLFRVTRLSEEIWSDQMRDAVVNHFPALHVVLRQPLDIPRGTTLGQCIRNSLYDVNDEKSQTLRKYFSKNKLTAIKIPYNKELKQGELELEALKDNTYKEDIMSLVKDMRSMDSKGTINGAQMNGKMVQELAKNIVEALNKNSWVLFSDTYTLMEKSLCDKAFEKMIKPLQNSDYRLITAKRRDVMTEFSMQCVLKAEKERAERWINDLITGKQKAEEKQKQMEEERKKKEEEKKKKQEIEAQRVREEKQHRQRMEQERQNREEAERRRNEEQENARRAEEARRQAQSQLEEIEKAKQNAKKKKKNDIVKALGVIAGVAAFLSDEQLKENITTISGSEYENIGLQGVKWTWNKKAQDLGMRGEDQGVIAQEVEKVYPWAVSVSSEGYKQVHYSSLKHLLSEKKKKKGAS